MSASPSPVLAANLGNLGVLEWVVVGVATLAAIWVIFRAVRLTLRPGEEEPDHIKRMILDEDKAAGSPKRPGR